MQAPQIVRLFDVLRSEDSDSVGQEELKTMLNGILLSHPGLEFLQETPEFQERCAVVGCALLTMGQLPIRWVDCWHACDQTDWVWHCRYAETVICRVLYKLDRTGLGKLTLRDLKR